jgi:hypothetical protein
MLPVVFSIIQPSQAGVQGLGGSGLVCSSKVAKDDLGLFLY